jgi:hypothetical protein
VPFGKEKYNSKNEERQIVRNDEADFYKDILWLLEYTHYFVENCYKNYQSYKYFQVSNSATLIIPKFPLIFL